MADDELKIKWVRGVIRAEMARRDLSYADLVAGLRAVGVDENERNLRNKINRGTFSAVFFIECLEAMKMNKLKLEMMEFLGNPERMPDHLAEEAEPMSPSQADEVDKVLQELRQIIAGAEPPIVKPE